MAGEIFRSAYVKANGIKTHYIHAGEGEPVVLVHGGGPGASGKHNWGQNIGALAKHFSVYAVDLVGYGYTDKPSINYTYQAKVDHIASFIDALCLDGVRLSGNSMGCYVVTRYMLDHPERVKKLFMVATATVASAMNIGDISTQGGKVRWRVGDTVTEETMRDWLSMLLHNKDRISDELLRERVRLGNLPGAAEAQASYRKHMQLCRTDPNLKQWYDISNRLPRVTIPMELIWGANDEFASVELGKKMRDLLPNLRAFHMVEGAGHQVQNDQPEKFNELITKFFLS
jgi:pimeloyl-ACP methyl ester carboxylesterase